MSEGHREQALTGWPPAAVRSLCSDLTNARSSLLEVLPRRVRTQQGTGLDVARGLLQGHEVLALNACAAGLPSMPAEQLVLRHQGLITALTAVHLQSGR